MWACIHVSEREVHVVPCDDEGEIVRGHRADVTCECRPQPLRDAPLDEPVWSHREPTWPGALSQRLD